MKASNLTKHLTLSIILTILLSFGIAYPFLSGKYDLLAMPISTMIQVFSIVGLALVPVGILWLVLPKFQYGFAITSLVVSTFVALIVSLFATLSVGKSFGVLTLLLWIFILLFLIPKVKSLKKHSQKKNYWLPFYLICLPIFSLLLQLALAKYLTQLSRNRAIESAMPFISDIEKYHALQGHYPMTLQSQNKDYEPNVIGIEKYHYAPYKKGYNLSFEQPRFLLDNFGTREWVVYNPLDENSFFSHTAWMLEAEQPEMTQGWYASGNTRYKHWKYFLFD